MVVGLTNMPEFGQFPFTESQRFGLTMNPAAPGRTPGGSSGGSAAAVAAGLVRLGLGSDGGGSIRIPASCCGVVGLKPTRGRVSTAPNPDLWEALGCYGPITRSARDAAVALDVMAGSTPADRWRLPEPEEAYADAVERSPRGLRVGLSLEPTDPGVRVDPAVADAVRAFARRLEQLGHTVVPLRRRLPTATPMNVQMNVGMRAEAALVEDPRRLEARTRFTVAWGRWSKPWSAWSLRAGDRLAHTVEARFAEVDLLLTPTLACVPPTEGVLGDRGVLELLARSLPMVTFTRLFNVTGHPAISVPAGTDPDGVPIGAQLVAPLGREGRLLALAAQLEG